MVLTEAQKKSLERSRKFIKKTPKKTIISLMKFFDEYQVDPTTSK